MDRNEAIKIVKGLLSCEQAQMLSKALEFLIPELKENKEESTDEKVRKALIKLVTNHAGMDLFIEYDIHLDEALTWLEKQAEQKPTEWIQELESKLANATPKQLAEWKEKYFKEEPAEWSEEDEYYRNIILYILNNECVGKTDKEDAINWLKYRVQPKQEILEKLEEWLDEYVSDLANVDTASLICSFRNYLDGKLPKSLRPHSQWKPSKEQMNALKEAIYDVDDDVAIQITKLIDDLKEVMGDE